MTREAVARDRGLQPQRTELAWTRTSLAVLVSGSLVLVKDRDPAHLANHPGRLVVGVAAITVAVCVFALSVRRRRVLRARPQPPCVHARTVVLFTGMSILALTAMVEAYLVLPLL
jgi:uncharacterized membrane protein YidH (DUF202 family)